MQGSAMTAMLKQALSESFSAVGAKKMYCSHKMVDFGTRLAVI